MEKLSQLGEHIEIIATGCYMGSEFPSLNRKKTVIEELVKYK